jgi:hypothetical protein
MATTPDIDTENVSYLAYWNITNHGEDEFNPQDVTSYSQITSNSIYDNGVAGQLDLENGRGANFRVKTDGWFTVWIDDTVTVQSDTTRDNIKTPADITPWPLDSNADMVQNQLERAINGLYSELPNSGNFQYESQDVGIYGYHVPNASTLTALSFFDSQGNDFASYTLGHSYTAGTTINELFYIGYGNSNQADSECIIDENGETLFFANESRAYGAIDAKADGLASDAETQYTFSVSVFQQAKASIITFGAVS